MPPAAWLFLLWQGALLVLVVILYFSWRKPRK